MSRWNPTRRLTHLPELLDRVVDQRRDEAQAAASVPEPRGSEPDANGLERRVEHLEALVEGLRRRLDQHLREKRSERAGGAA